MFRIVILMKGAAALKCVSKSKLFTKCSCISAYNSCNSMMMMMMTIIIIIIIIIMVKVKNEMGWACGAYGAGERGAQGFGGET